MSWVEWLGVSFAGFMAIIYLCQIFSRWLTDHDAEVIRITVDEIAEDAARRYEAPPNGCSLVAGTEPTQVQWVVAIGLWRLYWPCGCVNLQDDSIPPPDGAEVLPHDTSATGDGYDDPYVIAHYEMYFDNHTIH